MTLSSRIAALTSVSREIDAEIADLLGWWPSTPLESADQGGYRRFYTDRGIVVCPNYTANIMHVFDECEKRGWGTWQWSPAGESAAHFALNVTPVSGFNISRKDRNLTLAACESLVRAVENAQP